MVIGKLYEIVFDVTQKGGVRRRGESADKVLKELKKEHKRQGIKARNYKIELYYK